MALDFPTSPAVNEIYTYGGRYWQWNGTAWDVYNPTAGNVVTQLNGLTGGVTLAAGSNITLTPSGNTITIESSGGGISGPYVISFNGLTGTVTGVSSIRGLTGIVGITNGSGIDLSVSGQTMTFSNTGVLSIDGGTGTITNVAKTNVENTFTALQTFSSGISASGATLGTTRIIGVCASSPLTIGQDISWLGTNIIKSDTVPILLFKQNANHWIVIDTAETAIQNHNGVVGIGDYDGQGNSTSLKITDSTQTVNFENILSFEVNSVSPALAVVSSSAKFYFDSIILGDPNGDINNVTIAIDNTNNSIDYLGLNHNFYGTVNFTNATAVIGAIVNSINGKTGAINFAAGSGITLTASGNTFTIATTSAGGGISRSITTITDSTTAGSAASTDYVYNGNTTGSITLTMPTAVSNTNRYTIKNSNTGVLAVNTTSSQTIDGVTAYTLNKQYQAIDLLSDNSNWFIV